MCLCVSVCGVCLYVYVEGCGCVYMCLQGYIQILNDISTFVVVVKIRSLTEPEIP